MSYGWFCSTFYESLAVVTTEQMEKPSSDREQALRRVKKQRDFQAQLAAFLVINAALWGIWAAVGTGYPWPVWFTGAWTIGVVLSAWDVYLRRPITDADVQHEMERLRPQR